MELRDGPRENPVQYIAARSITVAFPKAVIESNQDLDDYVTAVKSAYDTELKRNKRITL